MNTDTQIIILAAGKGTRMGGDIPKALTLLKEKPMLGYVLNTSLSFDAGKPITVVGYKHELVQDFVGERSHFALQKEQKGTGHAVMSAEELLRDNELADTVIILYADQPYVSVETLEKLSTMKKEKDAKIVIATALIEDDELFQNQFYNFGRIVRNEDGSIQKIVERKDASEEELTIREVNPAYFCLDKEWMLSRLAQLNNDNAQGEYYLTDLVQMAFNEGLPIESIQINEKEALGANTPEQLKVLESYFDK